MTTDAPPQPLSSAAPPSGGVSVNDLPPEALMFATRLFNAARTGDCEIFEQVLAYNAGVKDLRNEKGDTLVHPYSARPPYHMPKTDLADETDHARSIPRPRTSRQAPLEIRLQPGHPERPATVTACRRYIQGGEGSRGGALGRRGGPRGRRAECEGCGEDLQAGGGVGGEAGFDAGGQVRVGCLTREEVLLGRSENGCIAFTRVTTSWFVEATAITTRGERRPHDAKGRYGLLLRRYFRRPTSRRGPVLSATTARAKQKSDATPLENMVCPGTLLLEQLGIVI